ncbi:hypothetical protein NEAUS04_1798 [Nematocida ausubeli]|nr:hypothetical protein NEAUS06_1865 [Nematocida ausubeli]KAI5163735.1 hypothetical protein NEAUS04_1798 [Nematocida ausubeli]
MEETLFILTIMTVITAISYAHMQKCIGEDKPLRHAPKKQKASLFSYPAPLQMYT